MKAGVLAAEDMKILARRVGLEQEFFLVGEAGDLRNEADRFLLRCREAAATVGLDLRCFKEECVKSLVEITTPPCPTFADLIRAYLDNLRLAIEVAGQLGLRLYPLATYPLPITPIVRGDLRYLLKAKTIGYERFLHAGRCAGVHLHLELPLGTVFPDVGVAHRAPFEARQELLDIYNLATAFDPALVALTRSCPFYEGQRNDLAARTVHYRGVLGVDGVYAGVPEVGSLQPYAESVEDLIAQERKRYWAWFAAMDRAGLERRLFAKSGGNLHRASWNPVRLNRHGTVEIRSMDGNHPNTVLAVAALIHSAAERVRRERLLVLPTEEIRVMEHTEGVLLVPDFGYLNGELSYAAATGGVKDPKVRSYIDSFVGFASAQVGHPEFLDQLRSADGEYRVTEYEILRRFLPGTESITPDEGLLLVKEACEELEEHVASLYRRYDGAPQVAELHRRHPGVEESSSDLPLLELVEGIDGELGH